MESLQLALLESPGMTGALIHFLLGAIPLCVSLALIG
jgi:hypothetical protein